MKSQASNERPTANSVVFAVRAVGNGRGHTLCRVKRDVFLIDRVADETADDDAADHMLSVNAILLLMS